MPSNKRKRLDWLFRWFETRIDPFEPSEDVRPPTQLLPFYWHFVRQIWPMFVATLVIGGIAALIEVSLLAFLGQIVDLIKEAESPETFFYDHRWTLAGMAFIALILRPIVFLIHNLVIDQGINPNFTNLIRWQAHHYVLRQSLSFFQNDFAGRIASKIMQTGPALRESVVQMVDSLWFMTIYIFSAAALFAHADIRLMGPLVGWTVIYGGLLYYFVPRIRDHSAVAAETRSALTGRIVDSYTNIMTLKLFAQGAREDAYARDAMGNVVVAFHKQARLITLLEAGVWSINGILIVGTTGLALWLWAHSLVTVGVVALAITLVIRINQMSSWIMFVVTGVFENVGVVQEGLETISRTRQVADPPNARALKVADGRISFDGIRFHYGKSGGVIDNLSLDIAPGEKVGIIGRSGAGKSTLVGLLLRFYDLEKGRISIDGQDISKVRQNSLRGHIGMVTQDTSLLHRSVLDNITYGRPDAGLEGAIKAAKRAQAHDFILGLEDQRGRAGYDAHVGERGVKLSGGQRQRVAIARVLLKNAPILILDEATSALDSEIEAAIQESLIDLMDGKTVIAIAHRLSTIAAMDRLVVMDDGAIVEEGTHAELLKQDGIYAALWGRQSGGFLTASAAE